MNSKISKSNTNLSNNPDSALDYIQLFRLLPEPYLVIGADAPNFTIIDVNQAHCDMTGVPREKIIDRLFFDVFPDVSEEYKLTGKSLMKLALEEVVRTKKSQKLDTFRYDIAGPDGNFLEKYWRPTHYPVLGSNKEVAYIIQSSIDVTEELNSARRLHETKEQLQDALTIGKVGSWLWDIESDRVVANQTLARLFGVDKSAALEGLPLKTLTDAIHPDDQKRVHREINAAIKNNVPFESEYRVVSPEGSVSWILSRGRLELGKNGRMSKFPGVVVDITERHNLEIQIEEARTREQRSRQSSSLLERRNVELEAISRTKDEFVALASHQLRTPATAVKQYVGMVLQGYVGEVTEIQMDMLQKAFQSNERQIQIINQILNAARVDTGRLVMSPAPHDIRAQLEGIIDEMRPHIEEGGHVLETKLGKKPAELYADPGYLRMAIENVIHNATMYTPVPGRITVELKRSAKEVNISITDDGVGIKKADIGKLFTKFSRIHNPLSVQAGGSGIGLYLTAEIVRLHNGKITVTSKIRKGTTFTITLPLLETRKNDALQVGQ